MPRTRCWTGTATRRHGVMVATVALAAAALAAPLAQAAEKRPLLTEPRTAANAPEAAPVRAAAGPAGAKSGRIISGTKAPAGSWPWIASVRRTANLQSGYCGGTVIASDAILTAAHCVVEDDADGFPTKVLQPASNFTVVVGGNHLIAPVNGEVRRVTQMAIPPQWNGDAGGYGADAAILFLDRNVSAPTMLMADLNFEAAVFQLPKPNEWAAGWGSITTHTTDAAGNDVLPAHYPNELWNAQLDLFLPTACNQVFPPKPGSAPFWTNWHLCAGRLPATTCNGDSGGPHLVQRTDGSWVQIGITSIGKLVPVAGGGFLYCSTYDGITRVAAISDWAIAAWKNYQAHKPVPDRIKPRLRLPAQKVKRNRRFHLKYRVFDNSGETADSLVIRFHGRVVFRARTKFGEAKNKVYFFSVKRLKKGIYRAQLTSRDRAGNTTIVKSPLRVR
jgi:secreted trypsin-like serine protease